MRAYQIRPKVRLRPALFHNRFPNNACGKCKAKSEKLKTKEIASEDFFGTMSNTEGSDNGIPPVLKTGAGNGWRVRVSPLPPYVQVRTKLQRVFRLSSGCPLRYSESFR